MHHKPDLLINWFCFFVFSTSAWDQIEFLQSWKCEAGRKSLDMRIIPNTPKERMWWMWENVWGCAHSYTWRIVQPLQASSLLDFFSGKSTVESSVTRFFFFYLLFLVMIGYSQHSSAKDTREYPLLTQWYRMAKLLFFIVFTQIALHLHREKT